MIYSQNIINSIFCSYHYGFNYAILEYSGQRFQNRVSYIPLDQHIVEFLAEIIESKICISPIGWERASHADRL